MTRTPKAIILLLQEMRENVQDVQGKALHLDVGERGLMQPRIVQTHEHSLLSSS